MPNRCDGARLATSRPDAPGTHGPKGGRDDEVDEDGERRARPLCIDRVGEAAARGHRGDGGGRFWWKLVPHGHDGTLRGVERRLQESEQRKPHRGRPLLANPAVFHDASRRPDPELLRRLSVRAVTAGRRPPRGHVSGRASRVRRTDRPT